MENNDYSLENAFILNKYYEWLEETGLRVMVLRTWAWGGQRSETEPCIWDGQVIFGITIVGA